MLPALDRRKRVGGCTYMSDSVYEACEEILSDGCKIFLTADKGAMKGSHTHFVKIISWYSTKSKRIKTFCLDTDDSDGSSSDCANAIRYSFLLF